MSETLWKINRLYLHFTPKKYCTKWLPYNTLLYIIDKAIINGHVAQWTTVNGYTNHCDRRDGGILHNSFYVKRFIKVAE